MFDLNKINDNNIIIIITEKVNRSIIHNYIDHNYPNLIHIGINIPLYPHNYKVIMKCYKCKQRNLAIYNEDFENQNELYDPYYSSLCSRCGKTRNVDIRLLYCLDDVYSFPDNNAIFIYQNSTCNSKNSNIINNSINDDHKLIENFKNYKHYIIKKPNDFYNKNIKKKDIKLFISLFFNF